VWIPDRKQQGKVVAEMGPRSYTVKTPNTEVRRNRRQLDPIPKRTTVKTTSLLTTPYLLDQYRKNRYISNVR
jgi:hypothetical protein